MDWDCDGGSAWSLGFTVLAEWWVGGLGFVEFV